MRSERDLDKLLAVAAAKTGPAFGVARCLVLLVEGDGRLPVRAEWNAAGVAPLGDAGEPLPASSLAARERRTIAVADVAAAHELDDPKPGGREMLLAAGTTAVLAAPIVVFDDLIGVLVLHRSQRRPWTPAEVVLAEAVAGEIGLAVHTARLLRENERRLEEHAALLKVAQAVTTDLRFEAVLQRLVAEVTPLLGADAADCYLFDEERRLLRCAAVSGLPADLVGRRLSPGQGPAARAVAAGRPEVVGAASFGVADLPDEAYRGFQGAVLAPVTWLGDTRGVLGVWTRDPARRFGERDAELLDAFARLAAMALHNAESFEEHERQAQVERGFYRVAEVLGSPLSLRETLDALARAACETLGATTALVLEPRAERLVVAGSFELPAELAAELAGGVPEAAALLLAPAHDSLVLASSSLADDERLDEPWSRLLASAGYRSLLTAAVATRGERRAVVVLFAEERGFSDEDLALVRHLTDAARGALERSELFETERRARNLSQRLASIGARLVTRLDPAVVVDEVVREAPGLLEADAAAIRLLEGDELVVRAAAGEGSAGLAETRISSGAGLLGDVVQSRAPVAAAGEEARAAAASDPLLERSSACLAVPMVAHGGGLHGVISVYSREPRCWREEELQALVALAAGASAGLSNAELYHRVAEEKERSEAILANIADGIVATDRDGRIVLWNAAAEEITGVPAGEALGRGVQDVIQRELAGDGDAAAGEREVAILRGAKEVWLSVTEAVMRDPGGAVAGRIFAFRDVSSERAVEQMKSDFVSAVSHELRTPLTSIYGFAETLLRSDVSFSPEERSIFLRYVVTESERLIRIVDDLLDVARLEAGTLGVTITDTDVAEVVREAVARVREEIGGDHDFVLEFPPEGVYAEADREKLAEVVSNLLDNAVKFSARGARITIAGRRRAETVEVRVTDEGVGIERSDLQRIFAKFYRAETPPVTGVHGTGLGLFLVRGLLAAMGGRVSVESRPGQGSTFAFELPAARWTSAGAKAVGTAAQA